MGFYGESKALGLVQNKSHLKTDNNNYCIIYLIDIFYSQPRVSTELWKTYVQISPTPTHLMGPEFNPET